MAGGDVKVDLSAGEWAAADTLGRRLRAAAKIAGACADAAAPLLLSSDLKVRIAVLLPGWQALSCSAPIKSPACRPAQLPAQGTWSAAVV